MLTTSPTAVGSRSGPGGKLVPSLESPRSAKSSPRYIAHMIPEYLGHTLNWVHTQITHCQPFVSYVLTSKVCNAESYPVEAIHTPTAHWIRHPLLDRAFKRMGMLPPAERWAFSKAIREKPPVLIQAHFGWDGFFALTLKRKFSLPLVTRFYGFDLGILPRLPIWRRRYQELFESGDLFLVEGNHMKATLVDLKCPEAKILVHRLGIDLRRIPFQPPTFDGKNLGLLMAASFKEKKGLEYALRALRNFLDAAPKLDVTVTVVGDGALRERLLGIAAELDLSHIRWLGYQPYSVFLRELQRAHVFLSPSVTASDGDTEGGAPVALIEAQAAGLPVVSTFHADIPEVVLHEQTGLLVKERSVEDLTAALIRLAQNPDLLTRMSQRARRHIETKFDAARQGRELAGIYLSLEK